MLSRQLRSQIVSDYVSVSSIFAAVCQSSDSFVCLTFCPLRLPGGKGNRLVSHHLFYLSFFFLFSFSFSFLLFCCCCLVVVRPDSEAIFVHVRELKNVEHIQSFYDLHSVLFKLFQRHSAVVFELAVQLADRFQAEQHAFMRVMPLIIDSSVYAILASLEHLQLCERPLCSAKTSACLSSEA